MPHGASNRKTGYLYECYEKVTRPGRHYHKRQATCNGERHISYERLVRLRLLPSSLGRQCAGTRNGHGKAQPRARTHSAGTRRTFSGTSSRSGSPYRDLGQGVRRGEALPLGEVNWTDTRRPPEVSSRVELHGRAGPRNERSKARPPGPTETYDIGTSQGGLRGVQRR